MRVDEDEYMKHREDGEASGLGHGKVGFEIIILQGVGRLSSTFHVPGRWEIRLVCWRRRSTRSDICYGVVVLVLGRSEETKEAC